MNGMMSMSCHIWLRQRTWLRGAVSVSRRRVGVTGTAAFVQALRARHRLAAGAVPTLGLVLIRLLAGVSIHTHHHKTYFTLTPRLALTVLTWARRGSDQEPDRVEASLQRPAMRLLHRAEVRLVSRRHTIRQTSEEVERTLRRFISRSERVEIGRGSLAQSATASPVNPDPGARAVSTSLPPIQRILAQPARPQPNELRPSVAESAPPHTRSPMQSAWPEAELRLPNIEHLAERVIQTIDNRIVAQRERLGRV